ncbi:M23 family metallopeptidase, partial [Bacteroidota bacterium]
LKTQRNRYRIDSLEWEMQKKDRLLESINRILKNEEPIDYSEYNEEISTPLETNTVARSAQDSAIRAIVNRENSNNLIAFDDTESKLPSSEIFFFCPLEGDITYRFNLEANHLGTDIVASEKDADVKATLSGVVVNTHWDVETGYTLLIQHDNDLISIYTHNSELMSAQGDRVKAGEAIAIVGNSGELTTGPHLHFELWHKGRPINPEEYILF